VTAQELLDALNKAQNESNLDQVAVWALTKYLQGVWKNSPGRNFRAYDLGQALSDFFVDLSLHRLPEKITNQTPQTEKQLLEFYGVAWGGLSRFWAQCIEIWSVTLEPYPDYAAEVKKYFEMLLRSSVQGKRLDPTAAPVRPPIKPLEQTPNLQGPAPTVGAAVPGAAVVNPASPSPVAVEPPVVPVSPVEPPAPAATGPLGAPESIEKPEQADVPAPAEKEVGSETPAQAPIPKDELETRPLPRNAFLVLQGTRVIPLNRPFIKIGRQLDNHIILEDPRVSRSHAQIKVVNDSFVIFDMNSTGGTFVNGELTSQSVLYPGDVVSLAGVVFIFSQEMPARPGDMKIIELGSPFAADRPTAVIRREEIRSAKKIGPKGLPDLPKTGPLR
jgi:pSer/pThr/pTyr-binding forkhead associated (FHA) protein